MVKKEVKKSSEGYGIASMVLGLVTTVFCWVPILAQICAVLAIVFYGVQKKKHGSNGMATTGLVLGIVHLGVIALLMLVYGMAVFAVLM